MSEAVTPERDEGPVALVTGAARGIGAATVRRLATDGWRVMAVDACETGHDAGYPRPTEADLLDVAGGLREAVEVRVVDVRDPAALDAAVDRTRTRWGRLDAVVAAAGIVAAAGPLWEIEDDQWDAVVETDLTGVWRTIRATLPLVLESPGPRRVVAVSSAGGLRGLRHLAAYAAAKHGVVGLVRSLAADLAGLDVTANVVAPGSTRTPILDASAAVYGLSEPEDLAVHQAPLGRLIEPDEVAAAICWLCGADASATTGAVLAVDGGMTGTQ